MDKKTDRETRIQCCVKQNILQSRYMHSCTDTLKYFCMSHLRNPKLGIHEWHQRTLGISGMYADTISCAKSYAKRGAPKNPLNRWETETPFVCLTSGNKLKRYSAQYIEFFRRGKVFLSSEERAIFSTARIAAPQ